MFLFAPKEAIINSGKEYSFNWLVENYSCCWHKHGKSLISPTFIAAGLDGTSWFLRVDPRGTREEDQGFIYLYLHRSPSDKGPKNFQLKFELSLLAADGSILQSQEFEHTFEMGIGYGFSQFLQLDEILPRRNEDYLPEDTLNVSCRMWQGEENIQEGTQIRARTRIGIKNISYLQVIEDFSSLEPNKKKTVLIKLPTKEKCLLSSSVYFADHCEGMLMVEITPSNTKQILFKCKIALMDSSGIAVKCGEADNRSHATRPDIRELSLDLSRKAILNRKDEYLPEDKLSLLFECEFSTGGEYGVIERILHELPPSVFLDHTSNKDLSGDTCDDSDKFYVCPSALDVFKSLSNHQVLTDMELKTKTKPASPHKNELWARFPVYRVSLPDDTEEEDTDDNEEDDSSSIIILVIFFIIIFVCFAGAARK